ncbi:hypothetical protein PAXRUDRAFT_165989 [Paxillus rubicundulus Ve08.2h10]|uniref:HTH CENPB-type domain-containing protein n=1 Tax=Paxillus rubicundulus Ve08.2h10 TaxID=930991 RepID=A0A0D0DAV7_9AGAM|nr:hypothetical protein PAXRUDRAFT_165989 [Paxillus rubicundulus Ve08.2h10]
MPESLKCKPRDVPAVKGTKPAKQQKTKDTSRTSGGMPTIRQNLTLADWMHVYSFVYAHPSVAQTQIVQHFNSLKTNALLFDQLTLSCKLQERPKMEAHIDDNPTALSSKRPHVVTSPAVELALIHWVQHMEAKGETATGPMLWEKCRRFEEELQVPEKERLLGEGWLQSFCKTYKICEHWQHREAGSVDTEAVQVEREHCQKILAQYSLRDRWNFDETALFP